MLFDLTKRYITVIARIEILLREPYSHKVESGDGRVYADLTPTSKVERLLPIDAQLKAILYRTRDNNKNEKY